MMSHNARQLALVVLRSVQRGAFADVALDRVLQQTEMSQVDRRLTTELVYGSIRRQRTLNALIDQLATKGATKHPPDLRLILHLGLYQLRYLNHIPASAAVDTTVELAKQNGFKGLTGFVNGLLRQYIRLAERQARKITNETSETKEVHLPHPLTPSPPHPADPLQLPPDPIARLAIQHSYPDWIVKVWLEQFGFEETERLCEWLNRSPHIDLRVNPLQSSIDHVETAMQTVGIRVRRISSLPQALRLPQGAGLIQTLPGFLEGWWTVQDSSAQLVSHLLNPQPGEVVVDACAAPGGKTTHLAELMTDRGIIWGCDRHASRLKKLQENADRLQLQSIQLCTGDSRYFSQFTNKADRVLLDAPCSGLGTLHRHADARWRQSPDSVKELAQLQTELLHHAATWVKSGGTLVYATCTLHPLENEAIVENFLTHHPTWYLNPPASDHPAAAFTTQQGWLKILPHQQDMDGFFMARLQKN